MNANRIRFLLLGWVLLGPLGASAHHSHANLDQDDIQRHTGVVSEFGWTMPHVFIKAMAPNRRGEIVEYSIELLHPPGMAQRGWSRDSFKPGDRITWEGPADRDPNRYYSGLRWAETGGGERLSMERTQLPTEPSTDFSGIWVRSLGGARPDYEPPADWPYTERARPLIANFNEDQNPQLDCQNPGPPKSTLLPYPIRISRPDDQTIVMDYELREEPRIVTFDTTMEPGDPSKLGHSIARLDGDTLVIETANFAADRWGTQTGVDSSDQKHLVERLTLEPDGLAINIEMTVTDPVYLAAPVVIDRRYVKVPDRELIEVECTLESARLFLEGGL